MTYRLGVASLGVAALTYLVGPVVVGIFVGLVTGAVAWGAHLSHLRQKCDNIGQVTNVHESEF
jgi:hypothetical protein